MNRQIFGLLCVLAAACVQAQVTQKPDEQTLWREEGKQLETGSGNAAQHWNIANIIRFEGTADGSILIAGSQPTEGKYQVGRHLPADGGFPWLTWEVSGVKHTGPYRALGIGFTEKGAIHLDMVGTVQEGLFVVPAWAVGVTPPPQGFFRINLFGTEATLKNLRQVKSPPHRVEITSSAGAAAGTGDTITFRVVCPQEVEDVTLSLWDSYTYRAMNLNKQAKLQLKPQGEKGDVWQAAVKIESLDRGALAKDAAAFPIGRVLVKVTILGGDLKTPLWSVVPFELRLH